MYAVGLLSLIVYLHIYFISLIQKIPLNKTVILFELLSVNALFAIRYFFIKKNDFCHRKEKKNGELKFVIYYIVFIGLVFFVTSIVRYIIDNF